MGEYKPPFTITNEILSYISSVSEKIGRITATSNLEAKPHLRKNNRIKSIHSSLKIEANSLSLGQVRFEHSEFIATMTTTGAYKRKPAGAKQI